MSLFILFHVLCAQLVSDINISIIRSLQLFCSACNTDTSPTQPHRNSNTHRTKNNTTNVVIQQYSRKLLMMDILMSETCWAHKKWNKIASDKFVFYSWTRNCTVNGIWNLWRAHIFTWLHYSYKLWSVVRDSHKVDFISTQMLLNRIIINI